MSEPFLAEIRMVGFNFAPRGWAFCDGQLVLISQNEALFSLVGTTYGGDGRTTFGLPEMRGRVPVHKGFGSGLSPRNQGQRGGGERATLSVNTMPRHDHVVQATQAAADWPEPSGKLLADTAPGEAYTSPENLVRLDLSSVGFAGGGQPHNNVQPFLAINFCIALAGTFPPLN